jgi:16S rRNA (cytosine1402-N4)-methyltransferase
MDQEPKKTRRVRYSGTHPKAFKEKYKELQPQHYAQDVENILQQGRTPAGMHRSICVDEILHFLNIQPGQIGIDATLGYGGHSAEILKLVIPNGMLYSLDVDAIELPKTKERLQNLGFGEDVWQVRQMNFSGIEQIAFEAGKVDFVLADLGISSMQIDNPDRGFSFKIDGPLDLRLNQKKGISAADFLKTMDVDTLIELLIANADEPNALPIATAICNAIFKTEKIETTFQLRMIIEKALQFLPAITKEAEIKKACQRCFQALRIAINNEFEVLDKFLEKLPNVLKPGGKVAILSFHSGEDRRVKKSFQHFYRLEIYSKIAEDIIRPSVQECFNNPRAKSAKLRWAVMG